MINSVTVTTNYCDLMIIHTHLYLYHQYIVNRSLWDEQEIKQIYTGRYLVTRYKDTLQH